MSNIEDIISELSNNFCKIISVEEIKKYPSLYWGGNGVGDRFANKKFNYTSINSSKKLRTYSENENETIDMELINKFIEDYKSKQKGIIGIYIHSLRENIPKRPISSKIESKIKESPCVVCGSYNDIICDHKNDLYNDERVLNIKTQKLSDFQPLCNHCNLQKRQVRIKESENKKLYSAKNMSIYKIYNFEFHWEKKIYDESDINLKVDTFWYDPVEFNRKIYAYSTSTLPIIKALKSKFK